MKIRDSSTSIEGDRPRRAMTTTRRITIALAIAALGACAAGRAGQSGDSGHRSAAVADCVPDGDRSEGEPPASRPAIDDSSAYIPRRQWRQYGDFVEAIPGFAGYYIDGEKLVVNLTDLSQAGLAWRVLRDYFGPGPDGKPARDRLGDFLFQKVRYSLMELGAFRYAIREDDAWPGGVVSIGMSVRENAIKIGVRDEEAREGIEAALERLEIPADGVRLRVTGYIILD